MFQDDREGHYCHLFRGHIVKFAPDLKLILEATSGGTKAEHFTAMSTRSKASCLKIFFEEGLEVKKHDSRRKKSGARCTCNLVRELDARPVC